MSSGVTVWLTGLSGSGKTTICRLAEQQLRSEGRMVERLDGDEIRARLCPDLGFSRQDRFRNVERTAYVSKLLTRNGVIVLASLISPYRAMRELVRREVNPFVEIYVKCSLEECIRRDAKGLYRKALHGEIENFTGISDPYEEPDHPDLVIDTERGTADECVRLLINYIKGLPI